MFLKNQGGMRVIPAIALVTAALLVSCKPGLDLGVKLWDDGPYWASCNVGASTPEEYGDYIAWYETSTKDIFDWSTYKGGTDVVATARTAAAPAQEDGSTAQAEGAPAHADGSARSDGAWHIPTEAYPDESWRVPTADEWQELIERCEWTWTVAKKGTGYLVTGPNGNSIFLPAGGYHTGDRLRDDMDTGDYWTSTPDTENSSKAVDLYFNSEYAGLYHTGGRDCGRSVRMVRR